MVNRGMAAQCKVKNTDNDSGISGFSWLGQMKVQKEDNEDARSDFVKIAHPTSIESKWNGLAPGESYSVSLIDDDA